MFEVKVTVDLGEKTVALLTGSIAIANGLKAESTQPLKAVAEAATETEAKAETPTPKAPAAKKEAKAAKGWGDMDDDAKLEAIKAEVTKHTKKGKSGDIKFLLSNFDAGRASELAPDDYDAFYEAVGRYGKGESVEDIFPGDLN